VIESEKRRRRGKRVAKSREEKDRMEREGKRAKERRGRDKLD
jgi:hypothetical protein